MWQVKGYKKGENVRVFAEKGQYVSDMIDLIHKAVEAGSDHMIVNKLSED